MAQSDIDLIVSNECVKTLALLVKWITLGLLLNAISDYYTLRT